jgi:hypothetical protein
VPFPRLLALVASDGLLRQAAARAGPLAGRCAALADFPAVGARRKAVLLIDRCCHDFVPRSTQSSRRRILP